MLLSGDDIFYILETCLISFARVKLAWEVMKLSLPLAPTFRRNNRQDAHGIAFAFWCISKAVPQRSRAHVLSFLPSFPPLPRPRSLSSPPPPPPSLCTNGF